MKKKKKIPLLSNKHFSTAGKAPIVTVPWQQKSNLS